MNPFFIFLIVISIIYCNVTSKEVSLKLLSLPKEGTILFMDIFSSLIFWSGILEISIKSKLIDKMTMILKWPLSKIFKLPYESKALDYISLNYVSNFMGIGSAATSFGISAMKELQELNLNKERPTNQMILFLIINVQGLCLIPSSVYKIRESFQGNFYSSLLLLSYLLPFLTILSMIFIFHFFLNSDAN